MTTTARPASQSSVPPRPPSGLAFRSALAAVNDMLERLDSVTDAGRRHLMSKIVAVLSAHPMASADPRVGAQVADLRREAGKPAPDGRSFLGVARPLLATLLWVP